MTPLHDLLGDLFHAVTAHDPDEPVANRLLGAGAMLLGGLGCGAVAWWVLAGAFAGWGTVETTSTRTSGSSFGDFVWFMALGGGVLALVGLALVLASLVAVANVAFGPRSGGHDDE